MDLEKIIGPDSKIIETGIRPGEKLHEEMISLEDSRRTIIADGRFTVMPVQAEWGYERPVGTMMTENTSYRSDTNESWVTKEEILKIIKNLELLND